MKQEPYSDTLSKYSYPFYLGTKNAARPGGTGFFFEKYGSIYFATAMHTLYKEIKPNADLLDFSDILIYYTPWDWKSENYLIYNRSKIKLMPYCFQKGCGDVVIFRVQIPDSVRINITPTLQNYEPDLFNVGRDIAIVGYPNDHLDIVRTSISKSEKSSIYCYTGKASKHGASGAPVLMFVPPLNKAMLAGVYNGRDTTNEGRFVKALFLNDLVR